MTTQEFFEIAGYFANPIRNTRIEIEAREMIVNKYAPQYLAQTGINLPFGADCVTSLDNNANKWGREMRLYFTVTNPADIPQLVSQIMTVGGRPGYDTWDQRVNNREIIDDLFDIGFTLGDPQNLGRIQALIPATVLADFNNGFNAT